MKISVVIPFVEKSSKIDRSIEYIEKQDQSTVECEIIIVNACADEKVNEKLSSIEASEPEKVAIVNVDNRLTKSEILNLGMEYCKGDYILFVRPGDAINPRLFGVAADVIECFQPELVSFDMTYAHDKFDMYDDDPFLVDGFTFVEPDDKTGRISYLINSGISECYLCHLYSRSLIEEVGVRFSNDVQEENLVFAYPLMLLAEGIAYTSDNGYCFFESREYGDVSSRITERMNQQASLFEMLTGTPELYNEYRDEIDAHFIKEYYLRNLKMARAARPDDKLKLSVFEVLQYVTLSIVPKWIENDYIFSLNRDDRNLMLLLGRHFNSEQELDTELRKDMLITVITATYNRCDKIRESIECILKQSWQYFEYFVVDDCSQDETEDVVRGYTDDRIKYIRNSENHGVSYSRNIGIKNSAGNYIVCQDDDDFCRLDKLEKELECILNLPNEYGMVYCESINHTRRIAGITNQEAIILPSREMSVARKSGYIFPALLHKNYITATAGLLKKQCVEDVGMYDESLFGYEDWDLCLRITRKYEVGFLRKPLYDYYQRPGSLISNREGEHRQRILQALYDIDNKYVEDRKKYGIETSFKIVSE
jgi:glycosyltransferase involved in cell wall biosynthesis